MPSTDAPGKRPNSFREDSTSAKSSRENCVDGSMAVATCYLKEKMRFLDKWIHAFFSVLPFFTNAAQRLNGVGPGQNDGPMLATPQLRPSLGQPNRSTCQADTQQGANDTCDRSNRW